MLQGSSYGKFIHFGFVIKLLIKLYVGLFLCLVECFNILVERFNYNYMIGMSVIDSLATDVCVQIRSLR